jgi:hypothetical protein
MSVYLILIKLYETPTEDGLSFYVISVVKDGYVCTCLDHAEVNVKLHLK